MAKMAIIREAPFEKWSVQMGIACCGVGGRHFFPRTNGQFLVFGGFRMLARIASIRKERKKCPTVPLWQSSRGGRGAMPIYTDTFQKGLPHMGREHASREKKCTLVIFLIFVHKNVYRIRFQKIKIGPLKGFEKKAFFSLLLMRKRLSGGQK